MYSNYIILSQKISLIFYFVFLFVILYILLYYSADSFVYGMAYFTLLFKFFSES